MDESKWWVRCSRKTAAVCIPVDDVPMTGSVKRLQRSTHASALQPELAHQAGPVL